MPHPSNVNDLVGFTKADGRVLLPSDWLPQYGFVPEGSNFYLGVHPETLADFRDSDQPLNGTHRLFFEGMVGEVIAGPRWRTRVVLGLEPPPLPDPFALVDDNLDFVAAIAEALAEYQAQAAGQGGRLDMVVRFASEMNDPGNTAYGSRPAEYRASFASVRTVFRERAPDIQFCFSPALRRDLTDEYAQLTQYWPGDELVDVISGTWYVGRSGDFDGAAALLTRYCAHRLGKDKPFGLDEVGGRTAPGVGFDQGLERMFEFIDNLSAEGVRFSYGSVFVQSPRWSNADTRLEFLR